MRQLRRAFAPAVLLIGAAPLAGCALTPQLDRALAAALKARPELELVDTPFFPQDVHQCGPAALATVLSADHVEITPDALSGEIYIPGREGSLQAEIVAAARQHDRVAVRLGPQLQDVLAPLLENRPVLLLQNLGLKSIPAWHYAVLVGWNSARDELILRSGPKRRETESLARFLQTWDLGGRWAVIVADPLAAPPESVTAADWIAAVAPLESLQQSERALAAYESAAVRWPNEALVWQALANARYEQHDLPGAEQALEAAVALDASAESLNNLAQVRVERGCGSQALAALDRITTVPAALTATIADTRQAAQSAAQNGAVCR